MNSKYSTTRVAIAKMLFKKVSIGSWELVKRTILKILMSKTIIFCPQINISEKWWFFYKFQLLVECLPKCCSKKCMLVPENWLNALFWKNWCLKQSFPARKLMILKNIGFYKFQLLVECFPKCCQNVECLPTFQLCIPPNLQAVFDTSD